MTTTNTELQASRMKSAQRDCIHNTYKVLGRLLDLQLLTEGNPDRDSRADWEQIEYYLREALNDAQYAQRHT